MSKKLEIFRVHNQKISCPIYFEAGSSVNAVDVSYFQPTGEKTENKFLCQKKKLKINKDLAAISQNFTVEIVRCHRKSYA